MRGSVFAVRGSVFAARGSIFAVRGSIFDARGSIYAAEARVGRKKLPKKPKKQSKVFFWLSEEKLPFKTNLGIFFFFRIFVGKKLHFR